MVLLVAPGIVSVSMALGCALGLALWPGGAAAQGSQGSQGSQGARCPERLRIAFPDGPSEPFMRGQGADFAQPPGLLMDWVRGALRELGCLERAEFMRLPVRRVRAMVDAGQLELVAGVGAGGPVAAAMTLPTPVGARRDYDFSIGQVDYALFARRRDLPPGETRWAALLPAARVGVTAGTRSETLALAQGWLTEAAPSHESALQKLLAGRTPLLLVHSHYLDERLRQDGGLARQIIKLQPAVERLHLHVGARPAFARSESAFMNRMWRELCRQSAASRAGGACQLPPP